jgi:uncharacterized protein YgiM (DUF1202 family)
MLFFRFILAAVILHSSALTTDRTLSSAADQLPSKDQCETKAYVIETTGLNVRRQANISGKILAKLPKSTEVNILGLKGNWSLISVISPKAQKVSFYGEGWVFSSKLGVSSKGYDRKSVSLYSRPSVRSTVAGKISPNSEAIVLDCSGRWLQVETPQTKGWLEPSQQCAAAYTSCS